MNFNASSEINEGRHDLGISTDSESIKSQNSQSGNQVQINSTENHSIKESDNQSIKKIHHNVSSFSELGDFLSESAPNELTAHSSITNIENIQPIKTIQPTQTIQSKRKKKPFKRQPIKIDFSKIFSQDNNFNFPDEPKDNKNNNNNKINSDFSFEPVENESIQTKTPNSENIENDIKIDGKLEEIENRIIDYFNHSLNLMITDFQNDLHDLLNGMNATESLIQSFGMELKKNIRQIINFKIPRSAILDMDSVDASLLSYKSFLLDFNYFYPNDSNKIQDSIIECKKSVSSQIDRINSKIVPSINKFQDLVSELHQLQQSILQKEAKADFRRSSILQRLAELEFCEIMQNTESDLFALKRSRSNLSMPKYDDDYDRKEFLDQIYKFIKHYKRYQNNNSYKANIKRYSKLINETFDDLQNTCDIYNIKMRKVFSSINYVQNQKNIALISNIRNTIINEQLSMSNNFNSNVQNNISIANNDRNIKRNNNNSSQKDILNEDYMKKKKDYYRNEDKHKNDIRYIEDLRRHDHRKVHHKSSK